MQVIITEASKIIQDVGRSWRAVAEGESMGRMGSLTEGPAVLRSPLKNWKVMIKNWYLDSLKFLDADKNICNSKDVP